MCDFCDGDGWILNDPELGPCVCVTPETIQELRGAIREHERNADDWCGAQDALAAYLLSIGLSAAPLTGMSPELAALVERLG